MALFSEYTTKEIIAKYGLNNEKRLGQHFIINQSLTDRIVQDIDIKGRDVIEIGPGPACLTRAILKQGVKSLTLLEIDQRFEPLLADIKRDYSNVDYRICDALEFDFSIAKDSIIISNLPYNVSTALLIKFCKNIEYIDQMLLMFQKEVGQRIISDSGNKKFGRLTVIANSFFDCKATLTVSPDSFFPPPKIQSQIIYFSRAQKIAVEKFSKLESITSKLFNQRRKKLSSIVSRQALEKVGINPDFRAEQLSLEDFYKLVESSDLNINKK
jgi:16S rRNA (adenine1518-N6/adenine1519-N6)-dimethyltransferase